MIFRLNTAFLLLFGALHLFSQNSSLTIVKIDSINIEGNNRTKNFVIYRELLFVSGEQLITSELKDRIEKSELRLLNLNLFNEVKILYTPSPLNKSYVNITIKVIEKWYIWPIPFLEFSDRNFNVWKDFDFTTDRTNYGLYLFNYNLFGRNHTFKTSLVTGYNERLGFEYRMPFITKSTFWGADLKILYNSQHEVWVKTEEDKLQFYNSDSEDLYNTLNGSLRFSRRLAPYVHVNMGAMVDQIKIRQEVQEQNESFLLNGDTIQTKYNINAGFSYDTRDNIFLPTRGNLVTTNIGIDRFNIKDEMYNFNANVTLQSFQHIKDKVYSAFAFHFNGNTSKNLPYRNLRMFGYDKNVRGFENYVVDGQVGLLWNVALRYHLIDKPRVELPFIPIKSYNFVPVNMYVEYFTDIGKTYLDSPPAGIIDTGNKLPNSSIYSAGISVQMLFYNDRVIRFEYSLNSLKDKGVYIHFKKAI